MDTWRHHHSYIRSTLFDSSLVFITRRRVHSWNSTKGHGGDFGYLLSEARNQHGRVLGLTKNKKPSSILRSRQVREGEVIGVWALEGSLRGRCASMDWAVLFWKRCFREQQGPFHSRTLRSTGFIRPTANGFKVKKYFRLTMSQTQFPASNRPKVGIPSLKCIDKTCLFGNVLTI